MKAVLCALALLAPAGCHLIFPFQVDPVLEDAAVEDAAVEGGAVDLSHQDQLLVDLTQTDVGPSDTQLLDAGLDHGAPDAKPPVGAGKSYGWGRYIGTANVDQAHDVAVDSKGNVYVVGVAGGTVTVSGSLVPGQGWLDVLLSSFDAKGKHRWTKLFGGSAEDVGRGVALDSKDNVYITGRFRKTGAFGGAPLAGNDDTIFLASYDSTGQHRWSKAFGGTSKDEGRAVAVDAQDNVYITGVVSGSVSFAGGAPMPSTLPLDVFVASFSTTGGHRWSNRISGSSGEFGEDVAVSGGNVYLTGKFQSAVSFGGNTLTPSGGFDIFLASYTTALGTHRWSKRFGAAGYDSGEGLAVDSQGRCHLVGYGTGVDFGGGVPPPWGGADLFVASFDANGKHLASKGYGGTSSDYGLGLAVDSAGNLVVAGSFNGMAGFGGAVLTSKGYSDVLVASYTQAQVGSHRWSVSWGGAKFDSGRDVAVDAANNLYVVGDFEKSVDFGGGVVTSAGNLDAFLLKLTP